MFDFFSFHTYPMNGLGNFDIESLDISQKAFENQLIYGDFHDALKETDIHIGGP